MGATAAGAISNMTRTTYIPPAEVPAAEALKIEPHKQDDLARLVVIPIIQNVIGGVAVAGAILTVQGGAWIIWGWWSEEALLGRGRWGAGGVRGDLHPLLCRRLRAAAHSLSGGAGNIGAADGRCAAN